MGFHINQKHQKKTKKLTGLFCVFCPDGITPNSGLTGPINTHTHTHTYIYIYIYYRPNTLKYGFAYLLS